MSDNEEVLGCLAGGLLSLVISAVLWLLPLAVGIWLLQGMGCV